MVHVTLSFNFICGLRYLRLRPG